MCICLSVCLSVAMGVEGEVRGEGKGESGLCLDGGRTCLYCVYRGVCECVLVCLSIY